MTSFNSLGDIRAELGLGNDADTLPSSFHGPLSGNPLWVAAAYDWMMSGDGELIESDNDGGPWLTLFEVSAQERVAFGLDTNTVAVTLHSDTQGFIDGAEYNQAEFDSLMDSVGNDYDDNDDNDDDCECDECLGMDDDS